MKFQIITRKLKDLAIGLGLVMVFESLVMVVLHMLSLMEKKSALNPTSYEKAYATIDENKRNNMKS